MVFSCGRSIPPICTSLRSARYTGDAANGNPLPREFLARPSTSGKNVDGGDLRDLARYPVGMLTPLNDSR